MPTCASACECCWKPRRQTRQTRRHGGVRTKLGRSSNGRRTGWRGAIRARPVAAPMAAVTARWRAASPRRLQPRLAVEPVRRRRRSRWRHAPPFSPVASTIASPSGSQGSKTSSPSRMDAAPRSSLRRCAGRGRNPTALCCRMAATSPGRLFVTPLEGCTSYPALPTLHFLPEGRLCVDPLEGCTTHGSLFTPGDSHLTGAAC